MPESTVSPDQVVAYNLARVRKMRGLSQEEARELLKSEGIEWSKAVYSAAERSWDGKRVRQFEAKHVVAFSRAFNVPLIIFFVPPRSADRAMGTGPDKKDVTGVSAGGPDISWPEMFGVMLGGTYRMAFAQRVLELPREERHSADAFLAAFMGTPTSLEDYARVKQSMEGVDWGDGAAAPKEPAP